MNNTFVVLFYTFWYLRKTANTYVMMKFNAHREVSKRLALANLSTDSDSYDWLQFLIIYIYLLWNRTKNVQIKSSKQER